MFCSREASRVVLIALNVFIIICGLSLASAGITIRFGSGFLSGDAITLLNEITYDNVKVGNAALAIWIIMIVAGGMIAMVGLLGICGAWHSISCCMVFYVLTLIILVLLQLCGAGLWISIWTKTDEWMRGQLLVKLKGYTGPEGTDTTSKGFNAIFMDAGCCGINAQFSSGSSTNDFSDLPTIWYLFRGVDYLPATCCQGVTRDTIKSFVGSTTCAAVSPSINFYSMGCYDRLQTTVKTYSIIVVVITGIAFVLQMLSIWTSIILLKRNHNKVASSEAGARKNPPPYVGIDHVLRKKGRA